MSGLTDIETALIKHLRSFIVQHNLCFTINYAAVCDIYAHKVIGVLTKTYKSTRRFLEIDEYTHFSLSDPDCIKNLERILLSYYDTSEDF